MPDPAPPTGDADHAAMLRDLALRVRTLEDEITELRASLAREVRSRRIVVVEQDGFERIVLGARDRFGHITVVSRALAGASTSAELFANDPIDAEPANVGVALTDGGDVVGSLDVTNGANPRLWLPSGGTEHT